MRNGNLVVYNSYLFYVRTDGSVSGSTAWNGILGSADGFVYCGHSRNQNRVDIFCIPKATFAGYPFHILSSIMACHDRIAGDLLLFCEKKSEEKIEKLGLGRYKVAYLQCA